MPSESDGAFVQTHCSHARAARRPRRTQAHGGRTR